MTFISLGHLRGDSRNGNYGLCKTALSQRGNLIGLSRRTISTLGKYDSIVTESFALLGAIQVQHRLYCDE